MLWASSKRRKSRPEIVVPTSKSSLADAQAPSLVARRSSLGSARTPFTPLQSTDMTPGNAPQNFLIGRSILTPEEQQKLARQSPSPPPNFSLPRRDPSSSSSSSNKSEDFEDSDRIYRIDTLKSFSFGPQTQPNPPSSPGRSIGPLDEADDDELRRRAADETPRQSLAGTTSSTLTVKRDPRTPTAYYSPSRSDAASHHTFGTSSASSLSSPSRSGSRSRTTSSTTHTSLDNDLGGVVFNPLHHHPTLPTEVEFDSEEEELEFSNEDDDDTYDNDHDLIEVSSARGGGSMDGALFEDAFERQMYRDAEAGSVAGSGRRPSLPLAIPGVGPDMDRRERESSLATVRRPSRSLDDQVSILSLDSKGKKESATIPPPHNKPGVVQTVSVPESDGDWRSLSARAQQQPSAVDGPPIFTIPTFAGAAPPASAPNTGGGGGSFDGFGFDLDWSAMRSGITGLDMNDVAVHSSATPSTSTAHSGWRGSRRPSQLSLMLRRPSTASGGSVMYDPDTFLAAVRGWEGEDYERQRKYWTFRKDHADGRGPKPTGGSGTSGAKLTPVRSIASGKVERGGSILSGHQGHGEGRDGKEKDRQRIPWKGMVLNSEEIWNSTLVGSFKVRRIELRPQKPQQRVTIDPFRGPYTIGPKPPHDGAYTNIHKHSKVMAFSIHRHYKPTRAHPDPRGSFSTAVGRPGTANGQRGSVSTASGRPGGYAAIEERKRPTTMILLAPRHVQEAYTSTNTTKGLRSHGLLDDGHRDRDRERERENRETRSTRSEKGRDKEREKEKARQNGGKDKGGKSSSSKQVSSTGSVASTYRNEIVATPTQSTTPTARPFPPPTSAPFDGRSAFIGPTLSSRSASSSRKKRRDSLDMDGDSDSDTERLPRTTHNEAFSTMDASSIDQMVLAQDARYGEGSNGMLSRVLRRAPAHPAGPAAPHQVYVPPWVTLQSRNKQEERRRRHDVLSNSFEDVGLLPPKKNTGGTRSKKAPVKGVDIFAQVPADALFMLLPLWPGSTDPVSERNATRPPHEIPTEQRQYLLVSYKPTDERAPTYSKKHDREERGGRNRSSHSSPTSSADAGMGKGCDVLLSSYHISARLVSHADLQGSGVRVPDEGLSVLGPWHEAWLTMPQIATRDHGLLVIGTCASRDAGIEFDPEGLVKMGLCIPVPPEATEDELQSEPVAELTPIGKAVLEMAWIGCIAVTSFGPAGSS
ncbi:hypothetical protein R3P38DRAFT_2647596 [Favolaschia claudopus]|uniref:Uncharacterized protein n=1 Tax=Favolaschia claudopus TaxID=2862362 RepID=A0AAW0AAS2_9AGAR